jgi:hypothetical protein
MAAMIFWRRQWLLTKVYVFCVLIKVFNGRALKILNTLDKSSKYNFFLNVLSRFIRFNFVFKKKLWLRYFFGVVNG